jgi:hypothetical protein
VRGQHLLHHDRGTLLEGRGADTLSAKILDPFDTFAQGQRGAVAVARQRPEKHVESGEQRRCAVPLVLVGHRAGATFFHRQAGLGTVEGLDLRLLIDRKHNGVGGRIDIEPDNIAQLVDKLRVVELLDPVRPETIRAPDALDRTCTEANRFRHHGGGQWVASAGGSAWVNISTRLAISDPSGGMREGRVLSRSRPS